MIDDLPVDSTIYKYFNTFDSNDPAASVAIAGFTLDDINIYKDGSVVQRASTAGITLLDTDGIDFDTHVGIGGFSIDLSDNTDAGFYAAGSSYAVIIGPVTVDAATINFVAYEFTIEIAGGAIALAKTAQLDLDKLTGADGAIIASAQGPVTFTGTAGAAGLTLQGEGAGPGLKATGGLTGHGVEAVGGATSGDGLHANANGGGNGIDAEGVGANAGLRVAGGTTGPGIHAHGGATGATPGVEFHAHSPTGSAFELEADGSGREDINSSVISITNGVANKISDHVIRRDQTNVRASADGDTVDHRSILGMLSKVNNKVDAVVSPGNITVYEEDDSTIFIQIPITTDASAEPITIMDPPA